MRFILSVLFFIALTTLSTSQVDKHKATPNKKSFVFERQAIVDYKSAEPDFGPKLLIQEMPKQGTEKMEKYDYSTNPYVNQNKSSAATLPTLVKGQSFLANNWGFSTPNDNDMAISDSGRVISVVNTNIFVKNTITNINAPYKSLAGLTTPVNSLHQEFDPKVIYDPVADRFVITCLVGFVDTTSKIIVGFSQTNDPSGIWNLYTLPGDPLNVGLWSDYPMLSMTDKELFLSVNYLYNDSTWQAGFVETLVWQMKKDSGYVGLPINATLHSNIKFNNKPIRNLCPVKGGSQFYSPNMYFVSNRNLASQNDSVFLVNITDTIGAPTQTVTTKVMKADIPYFFPPSGKQTFTSQELATNDCRNLGAFIENNKIHYVHNTMNPTNSLVTVYYGVIDNPASATPSVKGYYVPNDTVDFAYPNISYAGNSSSDNTAIINFNHSSPKIFPGLSAIRADGQGGFSPVLRIQDGATYVNILASNLERWGDYTGSQRRYNTPGEVWVSGYHGRYNSFSYPNAHSAWVAQIAIGGTITAISTNESNAKDVNLYPNPSKDIFSVELSLHAPEYLTFSIYDTQGKLIKILLRDWVKVKQNVFSFHTQSLSSGVYFLKITGNNNTNITKKVIVE